ncbi:MAG: family oxidoreductase [Caulobacteraceae bacterium]|nr:family oxidoreductase [Caulobacteraceae bacterium]
MGGELSGKVALVTGGGAGLGLAIVEGLAAAGAIPVLVGRRPEPLAAAVARLGGDALGIPADIANEDNVAAAFAQVDQRFGRIDLLINNAGVGVDKPVDELSLAEWRSVIDTNLTGSFLCARAAFRMMKRTGGGRIINIGSIASGMPRANGSAYAATKRGLDGLTRAWSLEGREHGIAVSILHPGAVHAGFQGGPNMTAWGGAPFEPMGPEAVARIVVVMASLPPEIAILEATMLPIMQPFLGRS